MEYIPIKLTHAVSAGEERPPDLGWKSLGPLRLLDVSRNGHGTIAMEVGCRNTRVTLVCDQNDGGITVYRDDKELVETA
jgi:hypothetical protein